MHILFNISSFKIYLKYFNKLKPKSISSLKWRICFLHQLFKIAFFLILSRSLNHQINIIFIFKNNGIQTRKWLQLSKYHVVANSEKIKVIISARAIQVFVYNYYLKIKTQTGERVVCSVYFSEGCWDTKSMFVIMDFHLNI